MKHTSKSKRVIFPTDFHPFDYHLLKRSPMLCLSTQPGRVSDVRTQMHVNKKVVLDFTLLLSSNFLGAYILLEIHVVPLQVVTISCILIQKPDIQFLNTEYVSKTLYVVSNPFPSATGLDYVLY